MTREEIIYGLEIYTVGRLKKARVHIAVEELQKFIDEIKTLEQERSRSAEITQYRHDCEKLMEENERLKKALEQEPILDKIRAEIEKQEKWLLQAGYTAYNVDIAFDAIKAVIAESEG